MHMSQEFSPEFKFLRCVPECPPLGNHLCSSMHFLQETVLTAPALGISSDPCSWQAAVHNSEECRPWNQTAWVQIPLLLDWLLLSLLVGALSHFWAWMECHTTDMESGFLKVLFSNQGGRESYPERHFRGLYSGSPRPVPLKKNLRT